MPTSQRDDCAGRPSTDRREVSSDQESDSEDHRETDVGYSTSKPQARDHALLREEEERETLLTVKGPRDGGKKLHVKGHERDTILIGRGERGHKNGRRRRVRNEKHSKHKDDGGKAIYEMEEGGGQEATSSSSSSSSVELDRLNFDHDSMSKRRKVVRFSMISTGIAILFVLLLIGAYNASRASSSKPTVTLRSNGSLLFAPTTILISLDGFRPDFLNRGLTPTLNKFITEGISPKYMLPSFPSVTFPNHYTLVTGLYPESHGVVGNSFWDPELEEEFYYTDPARSMQPKWWSGGEPIWVTAEQQNVRTAIHMWPGSEAHITLEPTYVDKFNGTETLTRKVDRILGFLDMPCSSPEQRTQFIAAYVPVVDADGHLYGPNSTEIGDTITNVDSMLQQLFVGLEERNLTNIANIVIVSDHGMATTSTKRLIQLDELIDLNQIAHIDGWPLYGLRPKSPSHLRPLYDQLSIESEKNPNFEVYLRDDNMPERYHFAKNDRIAPLWVVPKTGWAIVHKEDFDVNAAMLTGQVYHPKGLHGYDHEHPLMRAVFIARGPAFPHQPNSRLEVFQNIEVYNIVCDSLGVIPRPNNGSLRLPLKPIGLHAEDPDVLHDLPIDLPSDDESLATAMGDTELINNDTSPSVLGPSNNTDTTAKIHDASSRLSRLLAWFAAKAEAARIWATNALKSDRKDTSSLEQAEES